MGTKCCSCTRPLKVVMPRDGSTIDPELFELWKAGDYYCDVCHSDASPTGYKYYWKWQIPMIEIDGIYYANEPEKKP